MLKFIFDVSICYTGMQVNISRCQDHVQSDNNPQTSVYRRINLSKQFGKVPSILHKQGRSVSLLTSRLTKTNHFVTLVCNLVVRRVCLRVRARARISVYAWVHK